MVLLFFLGVFGQRSAPYNPTLLSLTWRLQYGLGLLPIMYMLYHRIFRLQESAMWKARTRALRCHRLTRCCFARVFTLRLGVCCSCVCRNMGGGSLHYWGDLRRESIHSKGKLDRGLAKEGEVCAAMLVQE